MQERKKKMNEAIMEAPSEWNKEEKKAKKEIMEAALSRFNEEKAATGAKVYPGQARPCKENVENAIGSLKDEAVECEI